jgi:hypothetical protein
MNISSLIKKLTQIKEENGDLNVCVGESHDYWGRLDKYLENGDIWVTDNAVPKGPKSGESERAVLLEY